MDLEKYRSKAEMKEFEKATLYTCTSAVYFLQMFGSLLAFFHLCLVSEPFSGPSLLEKKFCRNVSLVNVGNTL